MENTNKEKDLMIFPNPTHSFLEFKITDIQLPIMIEIYDLSGMLRIKELVKKSNQQINLTPLKSGIYIVKSPSYRPLKMIVTHSFD